MKTIVNELNMCRFLILYICIFVLFTPSTTRADRLTEEQVRLAVTTWVRQVTADARPDAVIERMEPHTVEHRITAYIAHLEGGGYCLCGRDDWVLPVYLYSPKGQYDPTNPGLQCILQEIAGRTAYLTEPTVLGDLLQQGQYTELAKRPIFWQELISGTVSREGGISEELSASLDMMVINFMPKWHQRAPYNIYCPTGDTSCPDCCPGDPCGPCPPRDLTAVGCTAAATAQIMKYWWWPGSGNGDHSYDWDGDDSCPENGDPGAGAQELYAYFGDPYDWVNIANQYVSDGSGGWLDENGNPVTQAQIIAAANLSYEVAVAVEMDFGTCGSGAPVGEAVDALQAYFYYDTDAYSGSRGEIDELIEEIQWLRPFLMAGCRNEDETKCHSWVVYGYNQGANPCQFLMNMGWGPGNDDAVWYSCDGVDFKYSQMIGVRIAPASAVRFVGPFASPGFVLGSPNCPYQTFKDALSDQDLPDGTVLIFKAGTVQTFDEYPAVINKPLTLRGHEVTIM